MADIHGYQLDEQVITLAGDDNKSYLHGQTTQDINRLDDGGYLWAGHCDAKGKLWSVAKIVKSDNDYYYITSAVELEHSLREFKKYGVFSKVAIVHDQSKILIGLLCDDISTISSLLNLDFSKNNVSDFAIGKALKLSDNSVQLIINQTDLDKLPHQIKWHDNDATWKVHTIKLGLPRLSQNVVSEFVPQMVNLHCIDGISFSKGCYTGQETVARMKYLGKNKRAMYALHSKEILPEVQNSIIEMQLSENWRRAGSIIDIAQDATGTYLLAVLPNDIELTTALRIKDSNDIVVINPLPYSLED